MNAIWGQNAFARTRKNSDKLSVWEQRGSQASPSRKHAPRTNQAKTIYFIAFHRNLRGHFRRPKHDPKKWKKRALARRGPPRPSGPKNNPRRRRGRPKTQKWKHAFAWKTKLRNPQKITEHKFEWKSPSENAHCSQSDKKTAQKC